MTTEALRLQNGFDLLAKEPDVAGLSGIGGFGRVDGRAEDEQAGEKTRPIDTGMQGSLAHVVSISCSTDDSVFFGNEHVAITTLNGSENVEDVLHVVP
jgi:hypothetical protein